jgi:hypothetical protein
MGVSPPESRAVERATEEQRTASKEFFLSIRRDILCHQCERKAAQKYKVKKFVYRVGSDTPFGKTAKFASFPG